METLNWPITTGCESLGGGCDSCPSLWEYREKGWDYSVKYHWDRLIFPVLIKEPSVIQVSLGSDLFHQAVPDNFIKMVFDVMNMTPEHTFEVVTKRAERLPEIADKLTWTPNIIMGVAVESEEQKGRIEYLRQTPSIIKLISFVPLLGPVGKLDLTGIDLAGVRAETWGLNRACKDSWIAEIEAQCADQGVEMLSEFIIYNSREN